MENKEIIAYKLIKIYPGSPLDIGCTINKLEDTIINNSSGKTIWLYYGTPIIDLEKFSEFWEPVYKPAELVKSWEDAFNGDGYWIGSSDSRIRLHNDASVCSENKMMFKTLAQAKSALAFAQLSHIVADANGDWVADWEDNSQNKFVVELSRNKLISTYYCSTKQLLPIKSEEMADACLEKHRTLWEDFWMISK